MMKMQPVQYDLVVLGGGLDQVTPTLRLKPGVLRDVVNFECSVFGGYTRIQGYEPFDGRPSPANAVYQSVMVSAVGSIVAGSAINGQTSGATGVVIAVVGLTVYFTKATGAFTNGENVRIGVTVQGVVTGTGGQIGDPETNATYLFLAAEAYRTDITVVPGSGQLRGAIFYKNVLYAFRNNAGGTAVDIYKSSGAGWVNVPLGKELSFNTGLAAGIVDGNTVTGLTSGATGVVARVVLESGSFSGGTAAGRLILSSTTGAFVNGENLQVGGTNRATCVGTQAQIVILPNGRFEFDIGSFAGASSQKIYGIDGVNRGFEFDGTTYVPIKTGMPSDIPKHLVVHKKHLFFAFGASVQYSGLGLPYQFTVLTGGGEIVLDADVSAFLTQPGSQSGGALSVWTQDNTYMLYGSSSADWNLTQFNVGTGAYPNTASNLEQTYTFGTRGLVGLATSLNYGNFDAASLTLNLRPFVQSRRTLTTCAIVNREKSQYRVFFSDGYGLYATIVNGKFIGACPVFFSNPVQTVCSGASDNGTETTFFTSTDGFVYKLDAGTSFAGAAIPSSFTLTYNHKQSPRTIKRYRRNSIEMSGTGFARFDVGYSFSYGSSEYEGQLNNSYALALTPSLWDSFTWDNFFWDGKNLAPIEAELNGTSENIAVVIGCNSAEYQPFTINSFILHYTMLRGLR